MKLLLTIYHYLFFLLVATIPFEDDIRVVPNILMAVLGVILPFVEENMKQKFFRNRIYLLAIVLVLFIVFSSLIGGTISEDTFIIKKVLILVAVLILSIPIQKSTNILLCFVASIFLGNIVSIYNILGYLLEVGNFEIASGQNINNLLFVERLYFGLSNSLSVAFCLVFWSIAKNKLKISLVISVALSVFMVLLVASRMAIITVLIMMIIKLFYHVNFKKSLLVVVLLVGTIASFFVFNDNLAKRFLYVDKKNDLIYKIKEWEPRYVIWQCGYYHINSTTHNLFFGDGFYNTQQSLNKCYTDSISKEKRVNYFLKVRFNTHNQYLDLLMSKGLFGLVIFLFLIYLLFKKNKQDIGYLNILLVLVLFSLVENFLHRQMGVYLFALVLVVLTKTYLEENTLNE